MRCPSCGAPGDEQFRLGALWFARIAASRGLSVEALRAESESRGGAFYGGSPVVRSYEGYRSSLGYDTVYRCRHSACGLVYSDSLREARSRRAAAKRTKRARSRGRHSLPPWISPPKETP